MKHSLRPLAAFAAIIVAVAASPAGAGPTEMALLSNYIGEWSGSSQLVGGPEPEPFSCRLTINKGNQAKINYAGRCTLVNMNLSVSGTIGHQWVQFAPSDYTHYDFGLTATYNQFKKSADAISAWRPRVGGTVNTSPNFCPAEFSDVSQAISAAGWRCRSLSSSRPV